MVDVKQQINVDFKSEKIGPWSWVEDIKVPLLGTITLSESVRNRPKIAGKQRIRDEIGSEPVRRRALVSASKVGILVGMC